MPAAGIKSDANKDRRHLAAEQQGESVARDNNPVDVQAGEYTNYGKSYRTGDTCGKSQVHHSTGNRAASDILHLLVQHLDGRFRLDQVITNYNANWHQQPA